MRNKLKFEIENLPRNSSKEEIISEIKRVNHLINKEILTRTDFDKYSKISSSTVKNRFGTWKNALENAGLYSSYSGIKISGKMKAQRSKKLSDIEILNELKNIASTLKKDSITVADINNSPLISEVVVRYRFGSIHAAVKKAGLKVSKHYRRKYSDQEYYENLFNVWVYHGRQPKLMELSQTPSKISPGAYENHFGTWRKALESFIENVNNSTEDNNTGQEENNSKPSKNSIKTNKDITTRHISLKMRYKIFNLLTRPPSSDGGGAWGRRPHTLCCPPTKLVVEELCGKKV